MHPVRLCGRLLDTKVNIPHSQLKAFVKKEDCRWTDRKLNELEQIDEDTPPERRIDYELNNPSYQAINGFQSHHEGKVPREDEEGFRYNYRIE